MNETTFLPIDFSEIDITDLTDIDTAFAEICEPVDLLALGKVRWQRARQSAKAGIPVAPLRPNTKEPFGNCEDCKEERCGHSGADKANCPCVSNGNPQGSKCHAGYAATCDLVVVDYWFEESNYRINYLEHNTPLFVLDFDVVWVNGIATMPGKEAFEKEFPGVLETAAQKVVTPSGGEHYKWLRTYSGEMYRGSKAFGKQLFGDGKDDPSRHTDTKTGLGSYNVGPLSRTDDGTYEEVRSGELTELQADVFDRFKKNGSAAVSAPVTGKGMESSGPNANIVQISMDDLTEAMREEVREDIRELESNLAKVTESWHEGCLAEVSDTGKYVGSGLYDFETAVKRLVPIAMAAGADDKPKDSEAVVERKVRNWLAKGENEGLSKWLTERYQQGLAAREEERVSAWDASFMDWDTLYDDPEPVSWLPGRVFTRGAYIALVAPPKMGKTIFAKDFAYRCAAGLPFLGDEKGQEPLRVMYLDRENIGPINRNQLRALGAQKEEVGSRLRVGPGASCGFLDTAAGAEAFVNHVLEFKPDVLILDTLARFVEGKENDAETTNRVLQLVVMPLRVALPDISIFRLDHSGKDVERGARGSSAKTGDVDLEYTMKAGKGGTFILERTASRQGLEPEQVVFKRTGEKVKMLNADGDEIEMWADGKTGHVIANGKIGLDPSLPVSDDAKVEMLRQFLSTNHGAGTRQIMVLLPGKEDVNRKLLNSLVTTDRIRRVPGKNKSQHHYWVNDQGVAVGLDN